MLAWVEKDIVATSLDDIIVELDRNPELAKALSERLVTASAVLRLLDENPELMEELRARLLTKELLELPATFAKFVETTNRRFDEIDGKLANIDRRFDRIDDDFAHFRGFFAETAAIRSAAIIALRLGEAKGLQLFRNRNLSPDELIDILYSNTALSDISRGDRESFIESDLVIEARDEDGEICYIAVEVSNACDERDTDRAIAHAELLERFTGKRAYPAVAGLRQDDRILEITGSGDVFWYEMKSDELRPG